MGIRRSLSFTDEAPAAPSPPQNKTNKTATTTYQSPLTQQAAPAPRKRVQASPDDNEETPPFVIPSRREAWARSPPIPPPPVFDQPSPAQEEPTVLETPREAPSSESSAARSRTTPIPAALLALPRPVLAAAMCQKQREPSRPGAAAAAGDRAARQARRAWLEQHKLLQQREKVIGREVFPPSSLAEHELAELLAPVLAEAAELARNRQEEGCELYATCSRAQQTTRRLGELVAHVGAGGMYMEELRNALDGADAELTAAKKRHAESLSRLDKSAGEHSDDLDAFARRIEAWAVEDANPQLQQPTAAIPAAPMTAPTPPAHAALRTPRTASTAPAADTVEEEEEEEARMHAEVAAVDNLLALLGGAECGWEADEHAAYMRLRTQCLGTLPAAATTKPSQTEATPRIEPPATPQHPATTTPQPQQATPADETKVAVLIERATRELPGRDVNAVRAHEEMVARREAALTRRREIVNAWRARRREEAAAAKAAAEAEAASAEAARKRRAMSMRNQQRVDEDARVRQLSTYRERKLLEHAAMSRAEEMAAEEARRKAEMEQERRARVKEALSERSMQRQAEQAALRSIQERQRREEAAMKKHETQLALMSMQQRDAQALEKRKHAAAMKAAEAARREDRIKELTEAAKPVAAKVTRRDTERLTRPTTAASARREETKQRVKAVGDAREGRFGSSSLTFAAAGSRATPGWRNGL